MKRNSLVGVKFGKLTVVELSNSKNKHGANMWTCLCDCGNYHRVSTGHLNSGQTNSCGCLRIKHGACVKDQKGTIEYQTWLGMRQRCNNANNERYEDYGGRGIRICDSWSKFENFFRDMGLRPSEKHSLERVDNDGDYEPGNCIWETNDVQNRNQRTSNSNTSGVVGVNWNVFHNKWVVRITVNYKRIHVGYFDCLESAKEARIKAEIEYWGKQYFNK